MATSSVSPALRDDVATRLAVTSLHADAAAMAGG